MNKPIRIIEEWTRDIGIPDDVSDDAEGKVEIYNAARPFPCHREWQGEFVHGVFYGAIYPDRERASEYRERAIALDASRLVFVERATVEKWGRAYCERHKVEYEIIDFDDIARAFLRHSDKE